MGKEAYQGPLNHREWRVQCLPDKALDEKCLPLESGARHPERDISYCVDVLSARIAATIGQRRRTDGEEVHKHGTRAAAQHRLHGGPLGDLDQGIVKRRDPVAIGNLENDAASPPARIRG